MVIGAGLPYTEALFFALCFVFLSSFATYFGISFKYLLLSQLFASALVSISLYLQNYLLFPSNIICYLKLETWNAFCLGSRVWTNDDVANTNKLKETKRKGKTLRKKQRIVLQIPAKKQTRRKRQRFKITKQKKKTNRGRNNRKRSRKKQMT